MSLHTRRSQPIIKQRKPSLGQMCLPSACSRLDDLRSTRALVIQLRGENEQLQADNERLRGELEQAEAANRKLKDMLFGPNAKSCTKTKPEEQPERGQDSSGKREGNEPPRRRGGQPGHPGRGRRIPPHLEIEEVVHEVPENEAVCPRCGRPYTASGLCEESSEIAMEIRFYIKKHKRKRMFRNCSCETTPRQLTAAKPANIIPKGLYDHSILAFLLFGKYGMQVPINRWAGLFSGFGLPIRSGTVAGIFKKISGIVYPLYQLLQEQLKEEQVLYIDETGFRHFLYPEAAVVEDEGQLKWLWVFSGQQVTVYSVEPTRSSRALAETLGLDAKGVIVSDGAPAYRKFARETGVLHSRCWSHFRRHFQDAATRFPVLQDWAQQWLQRIAKVYTINARLKARDSVAKPQAALERAIWRFYRQMTEEIQNSNLHQEAWNVLTSGIKYWDAYTVFVHHPYVALDNNLAERNLRLGVLGRDNWYGVHAAWSGKFTAVMMSCIQTAKQHGLNPVGYLHYVLDTAAKWQGQPTDVAKLLPWNISEQVAERYSMKTGSDPP